MPIALNTPALPRWERVLETVRDALFVLCLVLLFVHPKFISPLMVLGGVLGMAHVWRHWRSMDWGWSRYLGLTLGYYLLLFVGSAYAIDPTRMTLSYMRCVAYALVPFMIVDLRPRRLWMSAVLLGVLLMDGKALLTALVHTLHLGPEGLVFSYVGWPEGTTDFASNWGTFHDMIFDDHSYFYYANLGYNADYYPTYVGIGNLLALVICGSRLVRRGGCHRWGYALLLGFLLPFFVLQNSRLSYVSALMCLGIVQFAAFRHTRGWRRWLPIAVLGSFVLVLPFTRLNIKNADYSSLEEIIQNDARLRLWRGVLNADARTLLLGVGTEGSHRYYMGHAYSNQLHYTASDQFGFQGNPHNLFLENLLELGVVGLLYTLLMACLPLRYARKWPVEVYLLLTTLLSQMLFDGNHKLLGTVMMLAFLYNLAWRYGAAYIKGEWQGDF